MFYIQKLNCTHDNSYKQGKPIVKLISYWLGETTSAIAWHKYTYVADTEYVRKWMKG